MTRGRKREGLLMWLEYKRSVIVCRLKRVFLLTVLIVGVPVHVLHGDASFFSEIRNFHH